MQLLALQDFSSVLGKVFFGREKIGASAKKKKQQKERVGVNFHAGKNENLAKNQRKRFLRRLR